MEEAGLLWETAPGPTGTPEGRLLQQLVIIDGAGKRHVIPFNIEWPADVLRKAVSNRGINSGRLTEIYLDPEHLESVKPVLGEVFPKFSAEHFVRAGAGQRRRTILFENHIGPTYLRAVATIALHGALRLQPEMIGDEWEFDVLRRFIRRGDIPTINPVQYVNDGQIVGIGDGVMLKDVGHVIAVETTETTVFTKLQFFVSLGAIAPPWVVRIGRRPEHVPANTRVAYYARSLDAPSADGHTGEQRTPCEKLMRDAQARDSSSRSLWWLKRAAINDSGAIGADDVAHGLVWTGQFLVVAGLASPFGSQRRRSWVTRGAINRARGPRVEPGLRLRDGRETSAPHRCPRTLGRER